MRCITEGRKVLKARKGKGAEGAHKVEHTALVFWTGVEEVEWTEIASCALAASGD